MARLVEVSDDEDVTKQKRYKLVPVDAPSKPFGEALNDNLRSIPRQIGLTARHGLEGVGDTLDMLSSPIRAGLNMAGANIQPGGGRYLSDKLGLPTPQNDTERVVGDATRLGFGAAVPIGLSGQVAKNSTGATQAVAKLMAANPAQQIASGAGAGAAGGYTRETGGDALSQGIASFAGGIAAPMMMNGTIAAINSGKNAFTPKVAQTDQIDITISNALKNNGMTMADLPENIKNSMRQDVAKAMQTNGNLSPDAIRRLADYKLAGATPTAATLTLDPAMVTQQKNLAKLGINSKDVSAQTLGMTESANNRQLIQNMNELGAARGVESEIAGGNIQGHLSDFAAKKKAEISALYEAARDSGGRSAPLDPSHFTQKAGDLLDQSNLNAFMPGEIRTMMNKFAAGETPLNVNTAEQFKTIVGNAQRASQDGNVKAALGHIRSALDDTPLLRPQAGGGNQLAAQGTIGQDAIDAFTKARSANRSFMQTVEGAPALDGAMNAASSKGFFQKHIIAGDAKSLESTLNVLSDNPQAVRSIRDQVLTHLKDKAVSGAADEVGKFSQSRYNGALKMLGEKKLQLLFSPEEVNQLKAYGRVASYEQFQPAGAAVNNSNTAAAGLSSIIDRMGSSAMLRKIPLGGMIADPMQNISLGMKSKAALNAPGALGGAALLGAKSPQGLLISPALFGGMYEDDKKKGLLLP